MSRIRQKPINPFIQQLMTEAGAATLKDYAQLTEISYKTLIRLADTSTAPGEFVALLELSRKCGRTTEELLFGVLGLEGKAG